MLKPGDHLCLSRTGKVFLTQYTAVDAFVSLTRTLGVDPEADAADMHATLDLMFHEQVIRNLRGVNDATAALGAEDGDQAERLIHYLEMKVRDGEGSQEKAVGREARGNDSSSGQGVAPRGGAVRKKRTT
jgi:hypothetical protein